MPQKGNPDAKKIKSSDHIANLEKQISQLQRQLKDAKDIANEISQTYYADVMKQEDDFEKSIMDKYPSLFNKNEDGTTKYAECGIGCPKDWQEIIDNLCGSIVSHQAHRYPTELNPNKRIRIFLFKRIWTPIWGKIYNFITKVLDPYKKYRPKNRKNWWIIPPDVSKIVETTRLYRLMKWFQKFNYDALVIKDMYTKKDIPEVKIAQIKTKFGGLRFYIDGGDDQVYGMIHFAEYLCNQQKKKNE